MKHALTFTLLISLVCLSTSVSLSQDDATDLIDKFISKQATKEGGEEYKDARKVIAGDLNNDGAPDLAVLYTIEGQNGTNNYVQYLAVFVRLKGRLVPVTHTKVGGKLYRSVELQSISKNVILLTTLSYTAKDAACCPSKKGEARYELVDGRLKQL